MIFLELKTVELGQEHAVLDLYINGHKKAQLNVSKEEYDILTTYINGINVFAKDFNQLKGDWGKTISDCLYATIGIKPPRNG